MNNKNNFKCTLEFNKHLSQPVLELYKDHQLILLILLYNKYN